MVRARKYIFTLLCIIFSLSSLYTFVLGANTNSEVSSSDWTIFRHDLTHSGFSQSTTPSTNCTLWSNYYNAGSAIYSSPAVVNNKVYSGSEDGIVYCIDATTGEHIWNYTTADHVYCSPAVEAGKVYIGSYDHRIYCLNASTGIQIWNFTCTDLVYASPTCTYDKVYVSAGTTFYCLNALTGAFIWSFTTSGFSASSSAATIAEGMIYIGSIDNNVYCLNATTGTYIWNYTTGGPVMSSPAITKGKIIVGSDDCKVYCLNATNGLLLWSYKTGGAVFSSPAIRADDIYVGSYDNKVYCLDANTGACNWNYATGNIINSSPAVTDNRVIIGSLDCKIYCLDAMTGLCNWSYTTNGRVFSSPAIANGNVYIGSFDGRIYCFTQNTDSSTLTPTPTATSTAIPNPTASSAPTTSPSPTSSLSVWISNSLTSIKIDQPITFNSQVNGGTPTAYKWYVNQQVTNATESTFAYTASEVGSTTICLEINDNAGNSATSNTVTIYVKDKDIPGTLNLYSTGTDETLDVMYLMVPVREAVITFDLSSIPSNYKITSATLRVRTTNGIGLQTLNCVSALVEMPKVSVDLGSQKLSYKQWYTWDVLPELVQQSKGSGNIIFTLKSTVSSGLAASVELSGPNSQFSPELVLTYTINSTPTPSPIPSALQSSILTNNNDIASSSNWLVFLSVGIVIAVIVSFVVSKVKNRKLK